MGKIKEKLQNSVANDRRMPISASDNTSEDLLSDYAIAEKYIYGVMLRIVPTKEVRNIPDDLFSHTTIQMQEINNKEVKTGLTCKEHYFFALNNSHLVTNLPSGKTIKSLQTYLNWLTGAENEGVFYDINPKVSSEKIKLSRLRRIVISDSNTKRKNIQKTGEASNKVIKLAKEMIDKLFDAVPDMNRIIDKNILSARLILCFSRPKDMTEEDYEKELSAYMKPISDVDNIELTSNKKETIKGQDILLTKTVEIDLLDEGSLNEKTVLHEMVRFLFALKNS